MVQMHNKFLFLFTNIKMIKFDNIYNEIYIFAILLAIVFAVFSNIKTNQLISVIIVILLSIGIYTYLQSLSQQKDVSLQYKENILDNDIKERILTNEHIFYIDKFPKKVKYLKENKTLMEIVTNLRFTTKFNKTRYTDIILNMNKLMKIYMYILADRYDTSQFIPIFIDIRENIVEIMYSLFMIIPTTLKHTYGLDPHQEIYNSIYNFNIESRRLLEILEKFDKIHNNSVYVVDTTYRPYNSVIKQFFP
jgi:hypothetical protein